MSCTPYIGTVSVGVSANCPTLTHLFSYFTSANAAATQSAQMLFRCRQLVSVVISVGGCLDDAGLPNSRAEVMAWVTRGHEARQAIPVFLRTDVGLPRADNLTPESDPAHLRIASSGTFEGQAWVSFAVEHFRSRRAFALRLSSILHRQGVECKTVESNLSAAELKEQTVATKIAKAAAERAEASLMAEHAAAAMVRRVQSDPLALRGPRPRLTEEQLAGDSAVDVAGIFGVSTSVVTNENWLWFYRGHAAAYGRAKAFFAGQVVNSHEPALTVTTDAQRGELVQALLRAVFGVGIRARSNQRSLQGRRVLGGGADFTVSDDAAEFLQTRAASFASTFGKDGACCRYTVKLCAGVADAAVESKREQLTAKRLVTFAAGALAWFGLKAVPVYAPGGKSRKKKPVGYSLRWTWTQSKKSDGKQISPPRPYPVDPERADWQLQKVHEDQDGSDTEERSPVEGEEEEAEEEAEAEGEAEGVGEAEEGQEQEDEVNKAVPRVSRAGTGGSRQAEQSDDDFMPQRRPPRSRPLLPGAFRKVASRRRAPVRLPSTSALTSPCSEGDGGGRKVARRRRSSSRSPSSERGPKAAASGMLTMSACTHRSGARRVRCLHMFHYAGGGSSRSSSSSALSTFSSSSSSSSTCSSSSSTSSSSSSSRHGSLSCYSSSSSSGGATLMAQETPSTPLAGRICFQCRIIFECRIRLRF